MNAARRARAGVFVATALKKRTPDELARLVWGEGSVRAVEGEWSLGNFARCALEQHPDRVVLWLRPGLAPAERDAAIVAALETYFAAAVEARPGAGA